jgi:RecB family exonuclease
MNNTKARGLWTSASQAKFDALCPGRHRLQLCVPEDEEPTDAAARGTRIHEWLANRLAGGHKEVTLLPEEFDVAKQLFERALALRPPGVLETLVEERLWLTIHDAAGRFEHSGQADCIWLCSDSATIIDFKTGWRAVDDEAVNAQLRDLAVLVSKEYQVSRVIVAIISLHQPPAPVVYEDDYLALAYEELRRRIIRVHTDPVRIPGPEQCEWCRAKHLCPEFARAALPVPTQSATIASLQSAVDQLTPEQLGQALGLSRQLTSVLELTVRQRLTEGVSVPGWALQPGIIREAITDPALVWERVQKLGITEAEFLRCVTVFKTKLQEVLRARGFKGKELQGLIHTITDGATEQSQSAPRLVSVKSTGALLTE